MVVSTEAATLTRKEPKTLQLFALEGFRRPRPSPVVSPRGPEATLLLTVEPSFSVPWFVFLFVFVFFFS